ncbi:hypothetical protein VC83_08104 [Pseudogymnoascus destructans]|uniref:Uncharacterized protein n=2 Tax=Pseudogymnoascus destructans TaxID=655981 RepID=L8FWA5_PSED2|nr:uncharacterized protein VC83_08104 [Pseudogymnoascus destructans]ELR05147.1 hypothetical protein GMDG_07189 [Pseudogymnoascus destructans 20631-21]OAF55324.1 hypothetical protein VC83_08104 [Pseudogymnoascus destructans]
MDAPFEGATTRSRSQNQDATQTLRADPELPGLWMDSQVTDSEGWRTPRDESGNDDKPDLTDVPSDEEAPLPSTAQSADRSAKLHADLEGCLETGRREVELVTISSAPCSSSGGSGVWGAFRGWSEVFSCGVNSQNWSR